MEALVQKSAGMLKVVVYTLPTLNTTNIGGV